MELISTRFGRISFDSNDVIRFEHGLQATRDRHWLILSDEAHPSLYWLQSVSRPELSIPVVSVDVRPDRSFTVQSEQLHTVRPSGDDPFVALATLDWNHGELAIGWNMPVIVDPRTRRGVQVWLDVDQTVQHAPSDQAVPLRKSA